jgi:hypothetical protein
MSESFFGFDTTLPKALEEERRHGAGVSSGERGSRGRVKSLPKKKRNGPTQNTSRDRTPGEPGLGRGSRGSRNKSHGGSETTQQWQDTTHNGLEEDQEVDDLGAQLDETYDEHNDETFGDVFGDGARSIGE